MAEALVVVVEEETEVALADVEEDGSVARESSRIGTKISCSRGKP